MKGLIWFLIGLFIVGPAIVYMGVNNIVPGFFIGFLGGAIIAIISHQSYLRILVMKSKDKTPEYIHGDFFYIVPEEEFITMDMLRRRAEIERKEIH